MTPTTILTYLLISCQRLTLPVHEVNPLGVYSFITDVLPHTCLHMVLSSRTVLEVRPLTLDKILSLILIFI